MMLALVIGASLAVFAVLLWLDWRARHRVRSVPAREVTPEQIRYATFHTEEDGR
ncbi:hypothetical protein [Streptomyces kaniharaensis]|uniref:hypothetical protein n=1 Tax=Streptomyces kaniharaensis TaxID=212423 RepID=UPI00129626D6|nr:hypothetical protein [Streptomyces kaniharaensis]